MGSHLMDRRTFVQVTAALLILMGGYFLRCIFVYAGQISASKVVLERMAADVS